MTKVAIIQKEIPHYRVRFFEEVSAQVSTMRFDATVYSAYRKFLNAAFKFAWQELSICRFKMSTYSSFWMKGMTAALKGIYIIFALQELQCLNMPSVIPQLPGMRAYVRLRDLP